MVIDAENNLARLCKADEMWKNIVAGELAAVPDTHADVGESNTPTMIEEAEGVSKSMLFMIDMIKRQSDSSKRQQIEK